jgi:hypothetical protein
MFIRWLSRNFQCDTLESWKAAYDLKVKTYEKNRQKQVNKLELWKGIKGYEK